MSTPVRANLFGSNPGASSAGTRPPAGASSPRRFQSTAPAAASIPLQAPVRPPPAQAPYQAPRPAGPVRAALFGAASPLGDLDAEEQRQVLPPEEAEEIAPAAAPAPVVMAEPAPAALAPEPATLPLAQESPPVASAAPHTPAVAPAQPYTPARDSAPMGPSLTDQIKAKMSLVEYASSYVKLTKGSTEFSGKCCFHEDGSPSLTISSAKQLFHCKGCGASGNVINFKALIENIDYADAKMALAKELGILKERNMDPGLKLLAAINHRYGEQLKAHPEALAYLHGRGFTDETITRFGLGFCKGDEFSRAGKEGTEKAKAAGVLHESGKGNTVNLMFQRITFPIRDAAGVVIGFGGRRLKDDTDPEKKSPKYINTAETTYFHKSDVLYGMSESRAAMFQEGYALVVEGYADVVVLHQEGMKNAVGVMGAQASEQAFEQLWARTKRIVFCLDGDLAGRAGALRSVMNSAKSMKDGGRIDIVSLPEGMDPDEYILKHGKAGFEALVGAAMPLSRYLLKQEMEGRKLESAEDRAAFLAAIAEKAAAFENAPGLREQLLQEANAGISAYVVKKTLQAVKVGASLQEIEAAQAHLAALHASLVASPAAPASVAAEPETLQPSIRRKP